MDKLRTTPYHPQCDGQSGQSDQQRLSNSEQRSNDKDKLLKIDDL